jgi:hypothetical protein
MPTLRSDRSRSRAVIYARVSSKGAREGGFLDPGAIEGFEGIRDAGPQGRRHYIIRKGSRPDCSYAAIGKSRA